MKSAAAREFLAASTATRFRFVCGVLAAYIQPSCIQPTPKLLSIGTLVQRHTCPTGFSPPEQEKEEEEEEEEEENEI